MENRVCIIIGASHAGVNCAFNLRKEGWQGQIVLFDADPHLPYHRPPLSKTFLTTNKYLDTYAIKSKDAYENENIELNLGVRVKHINRQLQCITLDNGETVNYNVLVLATGASPIIPNITGLSTAKHVFVLRNATDVAQIKSCIITATVKKAVVIGGGYIGLEIAASLKKSHINVTVLEREQRVLQRVTAPIMSKYFHELHAAQGVNVLANKNVTAVQAMLRHNVVHCEDGSNYNADIIIVGVGVYVNQELAQGTGIEILNGIKVNAKCQTSDTNIYAIGDCSYHYNPHYNRYLRLESVQNAVDQSKVAALSICGKTATYDTVPWFWSDQYDVKLQMVGLSDGYNEVIKRGEADGDHFSVWYFKDDELLAVDAVNHAKAYVYGTKIIKEGLMINKALLSDAQTPLNIKDLTTV